MYIALKDIVHIGGRAIDLRIADQKTLERVHKRCPHVVIKESDANTHAEPSESNGSTDSE